MSNLLTLLMLQLQNQQFNFACRNCEVDQMTPTQFVNLAKILLFVRKHSAGIKRLAFKF